ncbi:MAG: hypothetical protein HGA66_04440 [Holophaga sp.]|nr:hypothetical protein [Holophaga sp.]
MVSLTQLWLPILLASVFVFLGSSLVHMALKWHNSDYLPHPDEEGLRAAIRKGSPGPGQYTVPYCGDHKEMGSDAMKKKYEEGPIGFLILTAPAVPNMGRYLGQWFLYTLVISFSVAYLASRTLPAGTPYLQVFRVTGTVAFLAYAAATVQGSIWFGKPWKVTFKDLADGLIYAFLTAGAFGWLWPR